MRKYNAMFTGLLLAGLLSPLVSHGKQMEDKTDIQALATSPQWLTTKVYIEGAPEVDVKEKYPGCLLYTSPSPRDLSTSRMPSSA